MKAVVFEGKGGPELARIQEIPEPVAQRGEVLVRGRRAPLTGRVCMDQSMINVTHIPDVQRGDEVVLIGSQGDNRIRAEDVAVKLGTNNYETTSMVMARVPRIYRS